MVGSRHGCDVSGSGLAPEVFEIVSAPRGETLGLATHSARGVEVVGATKLCLLGALGIFPQWLPKVLVVRWPVRDTGALGV